MDPVRAAFGLDIDFIRIAARTLFSLLLFRGKMLLKRFSEDAPLPGQTHLRLVTVRDYHTLLYYG